MPTFRAISAEEDVLLKAIRQERLVEFNENIAKEVRLSGSQEELRAFQYTQHKLDEFGWKTELMFSDAYISLPVSAKLRVGQSEYACITHSMSTSVDCLQGDVIYVEKGTPKDLEPTAAQGKILLIDGLAVPALVKEATECGAKSMIFVNAEYTHEMTVTPVWGHPVPETADLLPRIPVVSVNVKDGERIKQQLQAGEQHCELSTVVDTGFRPIPTLVADLKGIDQTDDFVLFSGHIDSWHYGAMDNGSANALMLETAKILADHKNNLKRSLRLAFWSGHSHGRYAGSTWYCDTHWEEMSQHCVIHINVDSVGGRGSTDLTESNSMKETTNVARDSIGAVTGQMFKGNRFGRAGDQSFWGTGTPSLFMGLSEQPANDDPASVAFSQLFGGGKNGGFGWWWHTTEDTLDKIDPECLVRDTKVYLLILYRFLTDSVYPIDQSAAARDIHCALVSWKERAGDHVDLSGLLERAQVLEETVTRFEKAVRNLPLQNVDLQQIANSTIMRLSRILVPLNYVRGSVFDHDLALTQPAVPRLAGIDELVRLPRDSNEYRFTKTSVQRRCNEVGYWLKQAVEIVDQAIRQLPIVGESTASHIPV